MEEYKLVRIINEEPEFYEVDEINLQVDYFILCEEGNYLFGKNVFDLKICGMSLINWVVRVCGKQPKILKVQKGADVLEAVKPYIDANAEYSIVFYADTPLLSKNHINDLLGFVDRKKMNVCKFKRGLAFRNDYIRDNDEIYSIDEYDFASNDFFVVESCDDFDFAKKILTKKVIDYHKRNGVFFENEDSVSIDANIEIGALSKISTGVSIVGGTKLGENTIIHKNALINGSTIGDNSIIGANSIVDKSIVKNNTKLCERVVVKNSVVGNNVTIEDCSDIFSSSVRDGAVIKNNVCVDESRIGENSIVQKHTKVLGLTQKSIIGSGSEIGANSTVADCVLSADSVIDNNSKINGKVEK